MGDETRADLGQVADIGIVARPGMSSDDILELRESFEMFDPDAKGTISVQELRSSMESLGYGKSHVMYKLLEEAGDSRMNFDQFLDIVTARIVREKLNLV